MARKRRSFSPSFKAKIALEAMKGAKTIAEIAEEHKLSAAQINLWKKQLHERAARLFADRRSKPSVRMSDEPEPTELHRQIERLKAQLAWIKEKVAHHGD